MDVAIRQRTDEEKSEPAEEEGRDMDERFTVPPMPFEEAAKRLVRKRPTPSPEGDVAQQ